MIVTKYHWNVFINILFTAKLYLLKKILYSDTFKQFSIFLPLPAHLNDLRSSGLNIYI